MNNLLATTCGTAELMADQIILPENLCARADYHYQLNIYPYKNST